VVEVDPVVLFGVSVLVSVFVSVLVSLVDGVAELELALSDELELLAPPEPPLLEP